MPAHVKGDQDGLKDGFYDSFLPDGITIYIDDGVTVDDAATASAEDSVKEITDAMAQAVIDYVDSALLANDLRNADDISEMIDDAVVPATEGDYVSRSVFEERQTRTMEQARWTFQALNFFAYDGETSGEHPVWLEVGAAGFPSGLFKWQQYKADEGTVLSTEDWEDVYNAYVAHINEWPDSDI